MRYKDQDSVNTIKSQPTNWRKVKLGEIAAILGGFAFKSGLFNNLKVGYPVVKIQNIKDGFVDVTDAEHINIGSVKRDIAKFQLEKGNLLVAMTGATAGKVGVLIQDKICYLNQRVGKFYSKDDNILDKRFLHYSVLSPKNLNTLKKLADGSAQGNMSSSQIEDALEISFPEDINDQKRIADILSAFDDKIELNNKISQTLEKLAQAIFKEWFVKSEKLKVKSEKLEKVAEIIKGKKPQKNYKKAHGGDMEYLLIESFTTNNRFFTDDRMVPQSNNGDTIVVMDGASSGRVFRGRKGTVGSTLAVVKPKQGISHEFLFLLLKKAEPQLADNLTGSAIPHLDKDFLKLYPVPIPRPEIMERFTRLVSPILQNIVDMENENQKLASLRDFLLPKLMSGEVKI